MIRTRRTKFRHLQGGNIANSDPRLGNHKSGAAVFPQFFGISVVTSILIVSIVVSIYTVRAGGKRLWSPKLSISVFCRENVYCKLSGLVTEADWDGWTESDLHPFLDVVLECFGPKRLMFGSDRPLSLVTCPYKKWIEVVERATKSLSGSERDRIFCGTAKQAYRLQTPAN
jgi:hypothetical protein